MAVIEEWVTRGKCLKCGAIMWTNPNSPNVICECTGSRIVNHELINCEHLLDEEEWDHAVVADRGPGTVTQHVVE